MPIESILMVTHNIEEAVLMCDRILVFRPIPAASSPRSRSTCRTRATGSTRSSAQLVDDIYARMTAQRRTSAGARRARLPGTGIAHGAAARLPQPAGRPDGDAGGARPIAGKADLPALAEQLHMEVDDLFPDRRDPAAPALRRAGGRRHPPDRGGAALRRSRVPTSANACSPSSSGATCRWPRISAACSTSAPTHRAPRCRFRTSSRTTCREDCSRGDLARRHLVGAVRRVFAYDEHAQMFNLDNPK